MFSHRVESLREINGFINKCQLIFALYFMSAVRKNSAFVSQCFAVRSLGWVEIPEEELTPGKSSLAVNNCIQQLSHSKAEGRDAVGAWGEVRTSILGGLLD